MRPHAGCFHTKTTTRFTCNGIANAVALPIAAKLKAISENERLNKLLILESIQGIQAGTNPRVLQQILTTYLPEKKREAALVEERKAA